MTNYRFMTDKNNPDEEARFIDRDYSICDGVSMIRRDFEHGFGSRPKMVSSQETQTSDRRIKNEILDKLYNNSSIDASEIEVNVKDGLVSLKGWINSREEKIQVLNDAYNVRGVVDVDNNILIRNRVLDSSSTHHH